MFNTVMTQEENSAVLWVYFGFFFLIRLLYNVALGDCGDKELPQREADSERVVCGLLSQSFTIPP